MIKTVPAKHIVYRTKSRSDWFGIDYNMNIYRGCCHGCIYCDSRSSCYKVEHFDWVRAKENALPIIRDDLRRLARSLRVDRNPGGPGARAVVGTGAMSDPYNPFEKGEQLTRHALELVDAFEFGAAIATKSDLIVRDLDILKQIQEHSPVLCKITITTADDELCRKIEPRVCVSSQRFEAIARLAEGGLFTGVLLMPCLPFLEDTEENVLAIVKRAAECGARFIYPAFGMTLRDNQRDWYFEKLEELFPGQGLPERYQRQYGPRYTCSSPRARRIWTAFSTACEEAGILYRMKDIIWAYQGAYGERQISFF